MKNEFNLAFNEVLEEKQLPKEVILGALESAMVSAYRRALNASSAQHVEAKVDPETGKVIEGASIERQTELVLEQMKLCLETADSTLENVLKCNVYCTSVEKFAAVNSVYARYFPKNPPARIFVCVVAWPGPFEIEIDCVATR